MAATSSMVPKKFGDWMRTAGGLVGDGCFESGYVDAAGGLVVFDFGDRDFLVLGDGLDDFAVLGMHGARDDCTLASGDAAGHQDRFGCAGGAVVHGGVGDLHAGEFADHGLELEHGLQRALCDLGLVGRVAGEELAALDERVDDHRAVVAIGTCSEEAGEELARGFGGELGGITAGDVSGEGAEAVEDFALAMLARDFQVGREAVLGGDGLEEALDGGHADLGEHGFAVGWGFG